MLTLPTIPKATESHIGQKPVIPLLRSPQSSVRSGGLAVCYDVRFPELFRALRSAGADIFVLPSAFTQVTGNAHWHVLTRARAIEQQCFMVAAAQAGEHENGRQTYGHALVIDGWGRILAETETLQPGLATALVNTDSLHKIRQDIPVAKHFNRSKKVIHASTER